VIGKLVLAISILAVAATPAQARGSGGHGSHGHSGHHGHHGHHGPIHQYNGSSYAAFPYGYLDESLADYPPVVAAPAMVMPIPSEMTLLPQGELAPEVRFPTGRWERHGNGVDYPYMWVWVAESSFRARASQPSPPSSSPPPR